VTKAGLAELRNEWAARVAAFRASGKSASAWCAELDLKILHAALGYKSRPGHRRSAAGL